MFVAGLGLRGSRASLFAWRWSETGRFWNCRFGLPSRFHNRSWSTKGRPGGGCGSDIVKPWRVLGVAGAGLTGLAIGYVLGQARGFKVWMTTQEAEVQGTLTLHAEALCEMRLGKSEAAVRLLETMLDTATVTL